jgi:hypothetical protein
MPATENPSCRTPAVAGQWDEVMRPIFAITALCLLTLAVPFLDVRSASVCRGEEISAATGGPCCGESCSVGCCSHAAQSSTERRCCATPGHSSNAPGCDDSQGCGGGCHGCPCCVSYAMPVIASVRSKFFSSPITVGQLPVANEYEVGLTLPPAVPPPIAA